MLYSSKKGAPRLGYTVAGEGWWRAAELREGKSRRPRHGQEERREAASRAGSLVFREGSPRGAHTSRSPGDGKKNN